MNVQPQYGNIDSGQDAQQNQPYSEEGVLPHGASTGKGEVAEDVQHSNGSVSTERLRKISAAVRNGDSEDGTRPLRLLISDRTALGCELMLLGLSRRRDLIGSVMCATSSSEVERVARTQQPEIALVSAALSDGPLAGFRVLPSLQSFLPKCPVIVLLDDSSDELAIDAFRARARGVFHRADPMEQLVKCIEMVRQGEIWARQRELRAVFDAFADYTPFSGSVCSSFQLNERELMVARLVATGQTNRQIGRRLNLSEHTVKNYLYRIFEKAGVSSRVELAVLMMNEPAHNGTNG
jgi:two-component system, NarL family, nitrate/nitrite response regulator NarL